ncbi:MAG: hypothetical protein H8E66_22370 [Planctomycetes bacterium]|nr:hypothetical protein [Planctomycetota bacterium]
MKRIALCFATVAALAVCSHSADASDFSKLLRKAFGTEHHSYHHGAQFTHAQHLADLERRAIEREFAHRSAHQRPLTRSQHNGLHRQLDRAAHYDEIEHRSAHTTRAYSPYYVQRSRGTFSGYGTRYDSPQYRSSQFRASQYRPYQLESRPGCLPYVGY